jgi:hypothetical protein
MLRACNTEADDEAMADGAQRWKKGGVAERWRVRRE